MSFAAVLSRRDLLVPALVPLVGIVVLTAAGVVSGWMVQAAPVVAVAAVLTVFHRTLLTWTSLLSLLVLVILLIPIRRYTMPGNLPIELEPYRLLVALIAFAWIASLLVDSQTRVRRSGLEGPLALFMVAAIGSVIVNPGTIAGVESEVLKRLSFFASFFLVFYLIVSVMRRFDAVRVILKLVTGGGAVLGALAVLESRTGYNIFNHLHSWVPFLDPVLVRDEISSRGVRVRAYASAQHPIALGAALVMVIPIAVYLARTEARKRWWLAVGLLGFGAVATSSRTSIMMLLVVTLVFLWLRPAQTRRMWPAIVPAIVVIHLALPGHLGSLKASFFPEGGLVAEQRGAAGTRGSGRIADLGPTLGSAQNRLFLGQGFGSRVVTGPNPNSAILDNQWLGAFVEIGLVGVIALLWLFLRVIRRLGRAAKEDDSPQGWLYAALAASIAAYAVGMLTFDAFSFIQVTFLMFILLGLAAVVLRMQDNALRLVWPRR